MEAGDFLFGFHARVADEAPQTAHTAQSQHTSSSKSVHNEHDRAVAESGAALFGFCQPVIAAIIQEEPSRGANMQQDEDYSPDYDYGSSNTSSISNNPAGRMKTADARPYYTAAGCLSVLNFCCPKKCPVQCQGIYVPLEK